MTSDGKILHDRYRVLSQLGTGGMGSVWRAEDLLLQRTVALKELVPHIGHVDQEESRARALVEARAMARVRHQAIVRIHDLFFTGEDPWIVMEYISGRSLAEIIGDEQLDERAIAAIGLPILQGLCAVHAARMVHRDVKPANILVAEDGSIFLVDFGIAKIDGDISLTGRSRVLGTTEYMAPERILGRPASAPADLWSLGVTLFYALERYSPFLRRGERSQEATVAAILYEESPRPTRPGRLADIIIQLLRKDPSQRPGAAELIAVLESILDRKSQPAPWPARVRRVTEPPAASREQAADPPLSKVQIADAVKIVSNSETDSVVAMLLAMSDERAAQILSRCAPEVVAELIQGMAAIQPRTAGAILQIFKVNVAGQVLDYVSPGTVASIVTVISVGEAVRILSQADARTAAEVLTELPSVHSGRLIQAMPDMRAVAVLGHASPVSVAATLRTFPGERSRKLLAALSPAFRALVMRHM